MAEKELQPTVRVMRLCRPNNALSSAVPMGFTDFASAAMDSGVSSCLTLPESFGDVFLGEIFSAYVAVVNDHDVAFPNVQLQVRVQTSNAVHDLVDVMGSDFGSDPTKSVTLGSREKLDMMVQHQLSEVTAYTMRVSIHYTDVEQEGMGAPKTLRKFYRFNVLSPLTYNITSSLEGGQLMVRGNLMNNTKKMLFLEDISLELLPELTKAVRVDKMLTSTSTSAQLVRPDGGVNASALNSAPFVGPDEVYAFCLPGTVVDPEVAPPLGPGSRLGHVLVKWHSRMGEGGYFSTTHIELGANVGRGPDKRQSGVKLFAIDCVEAPLRCKVGEAFFITLQVSHLGIPGSEGLDVELTSERSAEGPTSLKMTNKVCLMVSNVTPDEPKRVTISVLALSDGIKQLNSIMARGRATVHDAGCLAKVLAL